jgi:hypothetical protein
MPVHLQFNLSFQDYVEAQRLHAKRGWWPRLVLALGYTLVPIIGVLLIGLAFLLFRDDVSLSLAVLELGLGLFLVSYPLYLRLRWKRCYVRTRSESEDCTIDFDKERIKTQAANMRSEVEWSAIRSFSEGKNAFLLYFAPAKFFVVPKRVCTAQQVEELRSLFKAEIGAVRQ